MNDLQKNSIEAGSALAPEQWRYSIAIDYTGSKGLSNIKDFGRKAQKKLLRKVDNVQEIKTR